jgi:hypothetical protein
MHMGMGHVCPAASPLLTPILKPPAEVGGLQFISAHPSEADICPGYDVTECFLPMRGSVPAMRR